jgi:hypothetical protein
MKMHFATATLAAMLVSGGSVLAQMSGTGTPPLSATSPLAMGSGSPVGPTGIPLGSTEMTAPGTSPAPPSTMGCSTTGGSMSQTTTTPFDGGGMTGATSSACAGTGGMGTAGMGTGGAGAGDAGSSMPTLSTLQAGRANIPLGSTEINNPGLSPPPPLTTTFVSPIVPSTLAPQLTIGSPPPTSPPCPVTGVFSSSVTLRSARSAGSMQSASGISGC